MKNLRLPALILTLLMSAPAVAQVTGRVNARGWNSPNADDRDIVTVEFNCNCTLPWLGRAEYQQLVWTTIQFEGIPIPIQIWVTRHDTGTDPYFLHPHAEERQFAFGLGSPWGKSPNQEYTFRVVHYPYNPATDSEETPRVLGQKTVTCTPQ